MVLWGVLTDVCNIEKYHTIENNIPDILFGYCFIHILITFIFQEKRQLLQASFEYNDSKLTQSFCFQI